CVLAPQWVLLASTTRKLVAMLPDQQFDGPGLIPFSNNFDNFWFKVSKVLLTDSSPALLIRRLRWANEVIKDLDSFGVDTKTLTPRILLRESNALTVNELDGLRYLDQAFTELLKRLNISPEIHPALLTHREAFFSSSAARIERLQKEGATYINQISVFKKVFRERSGITVSTIHGVKGAEFDVVIAFGLLEGMVPHFNEVNGHVAASKLLYVLSSRARKNLHLISESERQRGRYSSYSATELLAAC
ncbi:TPA: ATP-dependent helicase, partial [Escherichia coli]|nr:ATP-dependent helicase [Escherichia coli]